jgi:hypothetical protein
MGAFAKWRPAAAAVLLLGVGLLAPSAGPDQGPLRGVLPADGAVAGWDRDGEPQDFEGEALYTYIDGGAEIYQEYGFRRAVVQDYRNAAGREVSLEIFEMADPAAAFGMFSFKRSGKGAPLPLGGGGELEAYYLNFWRGRFLVTLTGFDESPGTLEGLKALAGAAEKGLGAGGDVPGLVGRLPPDGLVAGSVKYIRGLLGLANIYPFGTARGLSFKEAVRGVYDSGETLLVLDYGSAEVRAAAWKELGAALAASGRFERPVSYPADEVILKDGKGNYLAFRGIAGRLAIGIHGDVDGALRTAARAR